MFKTIKEVKRLSDEVFGMGEEKKLKPVTVFGYEFCFRNPPTLFERVNRLEEKLNRLMNHLGLSEETAPSKTFLTKAKKSPHEDREGKIEA